MSIDQNHQICTLKLSRVSEMDVGAWGCSLESLAEVDGKYQTDSATVTLNLAQPPKLSIDEAMGQVSHQPLKHLKLSARWS